MPIDTIIFDLGNVIINFDHNIALKKISNYTTKDVDQIYKLVFSSDLIKDFEKGLIAPQDFFSNLRRTLCLENLDYSEFVSIWNEIFTENKDVSNIIQVLKENNFKIILITNVNKLHLDYVKSTFKILNKIDKIIASCEVGIRKPEPQIYQLVQKIADKKASDLIYIDDLVELTEAAKGLGFSVIKFESANQLRNELISYGITCL